MEAHDRISVLEAVQVLNLCEAYVNYLIQNGELNVRRDEKDSRYLLRGEVLEYRESAARRFLAMQKAEASSEERDTPIPPPLVREEPAAALRSRATPWLRTS